MGRAWDFPAVGSGDAKRSVLSIAADCQVTDIATVIKKKATVSAFPVSTEPKAPLGESV